MLRAVVVAGVLLTSGCSSVQPWVMPYEREVLADPIMLPSRVPLVDRHRQHVFETREGARGAGGLAKGGGCGCN
jgi:hypothetical protein